MALGDTINRYMFGDTGYQAQAGQLRTGLTPEEAARLKAQSQESREAQQESIDLARRRALGQGGPSLAELQMRQGIKQASQQARSQAAGARGASAALQQRMASTAQASLAGQATTAGAQLRAQEQMAAEQAYAQQLQQRRVADLQAQGLSIQEAEAQLQAETAAMQTQAGIESGEAERRQKGLGAVIGGIGAGFGLSDIRAKEDIEPAQLTTSQRLGSSLGAFGALLGGQPIPQPAAGNTPLLVSDRESKDIRDTWSEVDPYTYRYRPEAAAMITAERGDGLEGYRDRREPRAGIMAQDLERTPLGRSAVIDTPQGKRIDSDRAVSLALAETAALEKRMRELEGRGKRSRDDEMLSDRRAKELEATVSRQDALLRAAAGSPTASPAAMRDWDRWASEQAVADQLRPPPGLFGRPVRRAR